jgi:hypothetical protein
MRVFYFTVEFATVVRRIGLVLGEMVDFQCIAI